MTTYLKRIRIQRRVLATTAALVAIAACAAPSFGCRHTAEGVKADTKNALDKTGGKLQEEGNKIHTHDAG